MIFRAQYQNFTCSCINRHRRRIMKVFIKVMFLAIFVFLVFQQRTVGAASITIEDLGLPDYSLAYDINDSGDIVGNGFILRDGVKTDLPLGCVARGINSAGQVVGSCPATSGYRHAFLWDSLGLTDLSTLGGYGSSAFDINSSGQIAGSSFAFGGGNEMAFIWENGAMSALLLPEGDSYSLCRGYGINDSGQVVGSCFISSKETAVLWETRDAPPQPLGALNGSLSCVARRINNAGQVIGECYFPSDGPANIRAFLWDEGGMKDLGTLGGTYVRAHGINDAGQVVGESAVPGYHYHAFMWENDRMTDLGTLPSGYSCTAFGINNRSQAVGYCQNSFMRERAVLWTINTPPVANAGPDQTAEAGNGCMASVTLNGTGSSDPDGDTLTYTWTGSFGTASGPTPQVKLSLGVHVVTLTVSDGKGGVASDGVTITVRDTTSPAIIAVNASPNIINSSDHKLLKVSVAAPVSDHCDPAPSCRIVSVSSNEPVDGLGDGDTTPDWVIIDDSTLNLRAERSGTGTGRIYTIRVTCEDDFGNTSVAYTLVRVPHS
ncbi:MAG: hypothetical protein A4E65_03409 [Syntrophorhabdus sp. PtaU1.Bin153]|nr:MAG: hypothetical protein A4E65_03409 [Syntrophorhabdus sp. PtaU1.Bin153]